MLDPAGLLTAARLLLAPPIPDAQLRRAISTAYYAVFHKVCRMGAEHLAGTDPAAAASRNLLYRGFNHGRMKAVCASLTAKTLARPVAQQLGQVAASASMQRFATAFISLQEARHSADYDPAAAFTLVNAWDIVTAADTAMADLDTAPPGERAAVLTLMLLNPRG